MTQAILTTVYRAILGGIVVWFAFALFGTPDTPIDKIYLLLIAIELQSAVAAALILGCFAWVAWQVFKERKRR